MQIGLEFERMFYVLASLIVYLFAHWTTHAYICKRHDKNNFILILSRIRYKNVLLILSILDIYTWCVATLASLID